MRRGEEALGRRFARLRRFDRDFDREAWEGGRLAGVDEAGVGPLAGPVVAAAVVLPPGFECLELFDSKQMRPAERLRAALAVRRDALAVGVARVSPQRIDRINILRAMLLAHRQALAGLGLVPAAIVVDGRRVPALPDGWGAPHLEAVVRADARSLAVAAASVVAKVTRDRIMQRLDRLHPGYGLARHKGYATAAHVAALRRLGPSPVHRRSFCTWLEDEAELARQGTLAFAIEP